MGTATRSRGRRILRAWWLELALTGAYAALSFTAANGLLGFLVITGFSAGIWGMGFRHRHMPLSEMIRETYQVTKRMEDADRAAQGPARPKLTLVRRD